MYCHPHHLPLLFLLLLSFLLHARLRRFPHFSSPPCTAPTWLIGSSHSPSTLAHFSLHFHSSRPPPDLCIVFSSRYPSPSPFIYTLPLSVPSLHLIAARSGATRILSATDHTAFYTVAYGTGKGDVVAFEVASFENLLPLNVSNLSIRELPAQGFVNPESVLRNSPAFPRGAPLSYLSQTAGTAETTFAKLRPVTPSDEKAPVVHFLPNVGWDAHPLFEAVSAAARDTVAGVLHPDAGIDALSSTANPMQQPDERKRALALVSGAFAALPASPTLVERKAFWALAPLWCEDEDRGEDVIRGYVVQKTLQATRRSSIFVEPTLDVWKRADGVVDVKNAMELADRVEKVVASLRRANVPEGIEAEDAFLWLGRKLAAKGLISWCGVRAADEFVTRLRGTGAADGTCTVREGMEHKIERTELATTGICVTGQMRSAPYASANLVSRLRSGVGRFETVVVTERDDRVGSSRLFAPVKMGWSRVPSGHEAWIEKLVNSTVVHETMSTRRHLQNYLQQLADMRDCLALMEERERERGKRFEYLVRVRPDTMLLNEVDSEWWEGKGVVVHPKRHSFYAMNDRFFAGDRKLMGRLLSCHDVFFWLVGKGKVYDRKAGGATHRLWKKKINSERFLGRCASVKHVPLQAIEKIDARRVAYSGGVARWREF